MGSARGNASSRSRLIFSIFRHTGSACGVDLARSNAIVANLVCERLPSAHHRRRVRCGTCYDGAHFRPCTGFALNSRSPCTPTDVANNEGSCRLRCLARSKTQVRMVYVFRLLGHAAHIQSPVAELPILAISSQFECGHGFVKDAVLQGRILRLSPADNYSGRLPLHPPHASERYSSGTSEPCKQVAFRRDTRLRFTGFDCGKATLVSAYRPVYAGKVGGTVLTGGIQPTAERSNQKGPRHHCRGPFYVTYRLIPAATLPDGKHNLTATHASQRKTTVLLPFSTTRCSTCHFTARASVTHSTSRPIAVSCSGVML